MWCYDCIIHTLTTKDFTWQLVSSVSRCLHRGDEQSSKHVETKKCCFLVNDMPILNLMLATRFNKVWTGSRLPLCASPLHLTTLRRRPTVCVFEVKLTFVWLFWCFQSSSSKTVKHFLQCRPENFSPRSLRVRLDSVHVLLFISQLLNYEHCGLCGFTQTYVLHFKPM